MFGAIFPHCSGRLANHPVDALDGADLVLSRLPMRGTSSASWGAHACRGRGSESYERSGAIPVRRGSGSRLLDIMRTIRIE